MPDIIIKQAREGDAPVIEGILLEAVNRLIRTGEPLWDADEVKWDSLSRDYDISDFYIAYLDGVPAGCMALTDHDPFFWPEVNKGEALIIHKLAVTDLARKTGAADALIDFSKAQASARGAATVRLDTHALRPRLRAFYERHGFEYIKTIVYNGDRHTAFYVYTAAQQRNSEITQ